MNKIRIRACNAYYIGDYAGEVNALYKRTNIGMERYIIWNLVMWLDNFNLTTQQVEKSNPAISSIPQINLLNSLKAPEKVNI